MSTKHNLFEWKRKWQKFIKLSISRVYYWIYTKIISESTKYELSLEFEVLKWWRSFMIDIDSSSFSNQDIL